MKILFRRRKKETQKKKWYTISIALQEGRMQKEERKWAFDLSKDKYQSRREVSASSSASSSAGQIVAPLGYRDVQASEVSGRTAGRNAPAAPNMKELLKKVRAHHLIL
jgi:hypothetical protein